MISSGAEGRTDGSQLKINGAKLCLAPVLLTRNNQERIKYAAESFLVAVNRKTEEAVGFINALCTNEMTLRDELFTDTSLHNPDGENVMICSVAVLPEYRKQGIAREMMWELLRKQQSLGKRQAILTCVPAKIKMYKKIGFVDRGESKSTWGGEKWNEMSCRLNF